MDYKKLIAKNLKIENIEETEIYDALTEPPTNELGDFALPCFKFAKILHKSPMIIAEEFSKNYICDEIISEVSSVNGYVNFRLNRNYYAETVIKEILEKGEDYGKSDIGLGKTICVDFSSINIAKPFHIGHLSTTVLGGALCRLHRFLGYNVVGINHLGDYGTQFGKLIVAYKKWGNRADVEKNGVKELTKLYVKYHTEVEQNPSLDDEARAYFKHIEDKEPEAIELFEWFKAITLKDVEKIYKRLDITFDSYAGERFYNDKMQPVIDELNEKGLLIESEGAKVVDLEKYGMSPCIILRSDGASLYATRDLAAACYRKNTYDFYKCLYVVAYQQNLHFKQVFKVLELMGKPWAKDMEHVAFGMVSLEDGTMSTRHGKVILLEDVINKCVEKCSAVIEEKNPDLENKKEVAEIVGTGAVIFGALQNNKIKDIVFSYDKVLNFDGETGPYVQYTAARCASVLRKCKGLQALTLQNLGNCEYALVSELGKFKQVLLSAADKREPSFVTRYVIGLAQLYNKFYFDCKILCDDESVANTRKAITKATLTILTTSLKLLGIGVPEKM